MLLITHATVSSSFSPGFTPLNNLIALVVYVSHLCHGRAAWFVTLDKILQYIACRAGKMQCMRVKINLVYIHKRVVLV